MFNDKKKKILLIVVLILVIIIVGVSLDSCSNSMKEDQITHKTTTKQKSKSQSTSKAKNEKKDEQEVKQEEKKEETVKADSSSQSNTSESKKDNTASTSSNSNKNNTSSSSKPSNSSSNNSGSSKPSNNNGSSSNNSKPAEHTHNWVAQYKTVNVPGKGHNEQVLVQAAYDEQVPITEMKEFSICNQCGADITGRYIDHFEANDGCSGYHSEWREVVTGYKTVHHDAVYETRYVLDSPTTTKQELTGYKCSSCGKIK